MACVTQEASSDLVEHALQQGFGCRSRYPALCPRPFTASSSARASSSRASSSARMPASFSSCFRRAASKAPCALSMACCRRSRSFSRATSSFARSRARRLCSFSKASAAFRSDAPSLPRFGAFCAGDRHRHFLLSGCRLAPARPHVRTRSAARHHARQAHCHRPGPRRRHTRRIRNYLKTQAIELNTVML